MANLPTPLEPLDRLSEFLNAPRIWIKRDDCTGLATGGNKTRKLEFLIGDAIRQGYKKVITFGALQSNHVRQTAAAAAKMGLTCEPILTRRVDPVGPCYEQSGNLILDKIFGAKIHIVDNEEQAYQKLHILNKNGDYYVIPGGGSNIVGALGYVACAMEMAEQFRAQHIEKAQIFHATSSGGTMAGLSAGLNYLKMQGVEHKLMGINVYDTDTTRIERITQNLCRDLCAYIEERTGIKIEEPDLKFAHDYIGEDYGQPTEQMLEAVELLARLEGILVDPVYSGKALAGMIDFIRRKKIEESFTPVFIHTGGVAGLFAYSDLFAGGSPGY